MFQSYRVELEDLGLINYYFSSGANKERKEVDLSRLESLLLDGKPIDVKEVTGIIFPDGEPDIFLSHSYADIDIVNKFENYLASKKGLKVFIDSEVWGSVYNLLKKVDDRFCKNNFSDTYVYKYRNITTSNIFMALNSALTKMIDNSEVFMFIGSDNSLTFDSTKGLIDQGEQTYSPWIHSELLFSSMARINVPKRYLVSPVFESAQDSLEIFKAAKRAPRFIHPAPTEHLKVINSAGLENWLKDTSKGDDALDKLYELTNVNIEFKIK